jgi:hypothetical protein
MISAILCHLIFVFNIFMQFKFAVTMSNNRWKSRQITSLLSLSGLCHQTQEQHSNSDQDVSEDEVQTDTATIEAENAEPSTFTSSSSDHSSEVSSSSEQTGSESDSTTSSWSSLSSTALETKAQLKNWCCKHNIPLTAVTELLQILQTSIPQLPLDARTLLSAARSKVSLRELSPGHYHHFGLKRGLEFLTSKLPPLSQQNIKDFDLLINIDGVPLFNSENSFWLILGALDGIPASVFLIGAYFGPSKPRSSNEFLQDLMPELEQMSEGIQLLAHGPRVRVTLKWIVCNIPAKKFVKNTAGHSGYYSCDYCTTKGSYSRDTRTVLFPEIDAQRRTDESFRNRVQEEHHHQTASSFEQIRFDMVRGFSCDSMHTLYKGVAQKLLVALISGCPGFRISLANKQEINQWLKQIGKSTPSDFQRKAKAIQHVRSWKATELRLFCIYLIPLVLPKFLPAAAADLFLCFHLICVLLNCEKFLGNHCGLLQRLLRAFYQLGNDALGEGFYTPTVHCLQHLIEDACVHGSVEKFSAFQFENFNRFVKRCVRSANLPLQQLVNRVEEQGPGLGQHVHFLTSESEPHVHSQHFSRIAPVPGQRDRFKQFKKIKLNCRIELSLKKRDCSFSILGVDRKPVVCKLVNIIRNKTDAEIFLVYQRYQRLKSFFARPIESSEFGIYHLGRLHRSTKLCRPNEVRTKLMVLPVALESRDSFYAVTLLHTVA